jgi:hypothetical protein
MSKKITYERDAFGFRVPCNQQPMILLRTFKKQITLHFTTFGKAIRAGSYTVSCNQA